MKIVDVTNYQNKKLVSIDATVNQFFILIICHLSNFYSKNNDID